MTHTVSYDVFMKVPLCSSLNRNLSDYFTLSAPQRQLLLAGTHHMKTHDAARANQPPKPFVLSPWRNLCRALLQLLQVRLRLWAVAVLFCFFICTEHIFSWRDWMGSTDFHNNATVGIPIMSFSSILGNRSHPKQNYCNHCYHCNLLASTFWLDSFLYSWTYAVDIICSLWYMLFGIFIIFSFLPETPRQSSAHACRFEYITIIANSFPGFSTAIFLMPGHFYLRVSASPLSVKKEILCCRGQASRSRSQLTIRAKSVKRLPRTQNNAPKLTCGLPNLPTSPFMTPSSRVYGNLPYVCLKRFYSSQCAPQNCRRSSKWVLDYM